MPHVFGGLQDAYVFGGAITAGASVTWFREQFCRDAAADRKRDAASTFTIGSTPVPRWRPQARTASSSCPT